MVIFFIEFEFQFISVSSIKSSFAFKVVTFEELMALTQKLLLRYCGQIDKKIVTLTLQPETMTWVEYPFYFLPIGNH